jgi:UPF0716 protein FxsA
MRILFLLFIALPILELWLLFQVGEEIGFLPTVALVLATGALGVYVLRTQSFNTFRRAQSRLQTGELPGKEIMEGFFIAVGGALLLTPGFITDVFAIVLLLPFTRRWLVRYLLGSGRMTAFTRQPGSGFTFMHMGGAQPRPRNGNDSGQDVYEGEFTREKEVGKPLAGPEQASPDESKNS